LIEQHHINGIFSVRAIEPNRHAWIVGQMPGSRSIGGNQE
jgi:hypothetical protein